MDSYIWKFSFWNLTIVKPVQKKYLEDTLES